MIFNGKKLNAIIVDDVPEFASAVKFFLEQKLGCIVIGEATNGSELLNHKLLHSADIILIDFDMPGMNGIETARRVNFKFPSIKLIALTMFQDQVCVVDLIGAGFSGYVYKPDVVSKLECVINKVINNKFDFSKDLKIV